MRETLTFAGCHDAGDQVCVARLGTIAGRLR
jgi:hypothetical protein